MNVGDVLLELDRQRKNLAANLRAKSVTAADTETLAQLVPKVLQVPQEGGGSGPLVDEYTRSLLFFENGTVTDETAKPWTLHGTAAVTDGPALYGTQSLALNGSTDSISTPYHTDFNLNTDFCIEFFVRLNTFVSGRNHALCEQFVNVNNFWTICISGTGMFFQYGANGATRVLRSVSSPGLTAGNWHHVAVARSGSVITVYVDGVARSATGTVDLSTALPIFEVPLHVGRSPAFNRYLQGQIDGFRFSTGTPRYTARFMPAVGYPVK